MLKTVSNLVEHSARPLGDVAQDLLNRYGSHYYTGKHTPTCQELSIKITADITLTVDNGNGVFGRLSGGAEGWAVFDRFGANSYHGGPIGSVPLGGVPPSRASNIVPSNADAVIDALRTVEEWSQIGQVVRSKAHVILRADRPGGIEMSSRLAAQIEAALLQGERRPSGSNFSPHKYCIEISGAEDQAPGTIVTNSRAGVVFLTNGGSPRVDVYDLYRTSTHPETGLPLAGSQLYWLEGEAIESVWKVGEQIRRDAASRATES